MSVPGVTRVALSDTRGALTGYEVESERGRDVRRELATSVVASGWGLLELRPMRMSLEDVFLRLTTQESEPGQAAEHDAAAPAEAEEAEHE